MSKKENQDYDVIPVNWPVIIFIVIFFGILFGLVILVGFDPTEGKGMLLSLLILATIVWAIFNYGKNYILTKESITYRLYGISCRTILWKDVIQVGIALYGTGRNLENRIILTLKDCPKYDPKKERGHTYCERYPKKTLSIPFPEYNFRLFEKYYGTLDYGYENLELFKKIFNKKN